MRATDLVRQVLDILDQVDNNPVVSRDHDSVNFDLDQDGQIDMEIEPVVPAEEPEQLRKQNQIKDLKPSPCDNSEWANSPIERLADIEAVTTDAGGGMQGPKHPADIRGEHPSLFSDYLRKLENKE